MHQLDVDFVRQQFPALSHPSIQQWAFFENAGGSYAPSHVIEKLNYFMIATKVQPYGPSDPSEEAGQAMDLTQERFANAINANLGEVMFGPSTSINTYVVAQAMKTRLQAGDEIIVTNQDHEANSGAWRRLGGGNTGIRVREWHVSPRTGRLNLSDLEEMLNERTKLVAVTHCSNIAGEIHDVKAIAKSVHASGALLAVDGVSYAPHLFPDVRALDIDLYFFSLYKTYGPHQGLMYVRQSLLDDIDNQGHFFNVEMPSKRLTPAGPQHGEIACASGVIDYLETIDGHHFGGDVADCRLRVARIMALFHRHEIQQTKRILSLLRDKGVRVIGPEHASEGQRAPTIAFRSDQISNTEIVAHLRRVKVACGYGHFYAYRLINALGINPEDGVVRLSLVHYNSEDEVSRLLNALEDIL